MFLLEIRWIGGYVAKGSSKPIRLHATYLFRGEVVTPGGPPENLARVWAASQFQIDQVGSLNSCSFWPDMATRGLFCLDSVHAASGS